MSWLASIVRGLFEALLPFIFKKGPTVAEDSVQTDRELRRSWASRITDIMRQQPQGGDGAADSMDDDQRGAGAE